MNDRPPDHSLESRLRELAAAPDRSDWGDVVRRSQSAPAGTPRPRPRLRWAFAGIGVASLTALLGALLVLAPDRDETAAEPTGLSYTTVDAWDAASVPPAITAAIAKFGPSSRPQSVARVLRGVTFSGPVEVYRAIRPDGTYATLTLDGERRVRDIGGCLNGTVVVPADPPGAPARVIVPDVSGLRPEEASRRLQGAGLTVRLLDPPPTPKPGELVPDVGYPDTISVPAGTSLYAGTVVSIPAVERMAASSAVPGSSVLPCDLGGSRAGRWTVGAVGTGITGGRTEWPGGITVPAVVENGMYLLPFLPNDCSHAGPPIALVMTDAAGNEVARPDVSEIKLAESWQVDPPLRCSPAASPQTSSAAVFTRALTAADVLPPGLDVLDMFPVPIDGAPRAARTAGPAGRYGTLTVHAAQPADRQGACLYISGDGGVGAGAPCVRAQAFEDGQLVGRMQHGAAGDPIVLAGLLPDGFVAVRDAARTSTVEGNAWVLVYSADDPIPTSVTAVRSDGTTIRLEIPTS